MVRLRARRIAKQWRGRAKESGAENRVTTENDLDEVAVLTFSISKLHSTQNAKVTYATFNGISSICVL